MTIITPKDAKGTTIEKLPEYDSVYTINIPTDDLIRISYGNTMSDTTTVGYPSLEYAQLTNTNTLCGDFKITDMPSNKLKINVKYFNEDTPRLNKIDQGDWIDLSAAEDTELFPGEYLLIPLGVAIKLPEGYEAHIAPRSSTFKNWGFLQTNGVGVIDESYCGDTDQWLIPVYPTRRSSIKKGDRICQFRIMKKMQPVEFEEVEFLTDSNRGGHGSTGVK